MDKDKEREGMEEGVEEEAASPELKGGDEDEDVDAQDEEVSKETEAVKGGGEESVEEIVEKALDDEMTPEELARHEADYIEFKKIAEDAKQRMEIEDEDACIEYKKMMGLAPLSEEVKKEERLVRKEREDGKIVEEKETIFYGRCEECGVELPFEQLYDNGAYMVCKGCI